MEHPLVGLVGYLVINPANLADKGRLDHICDDSQHRSRHYQLSPVQSGL